MSTPTYDPGGKVASRTTDDGDATPLIIRQPDDWHVHLRDGALLASVAGDTARQFARAIVMPNLDPPVTTVAAAAAYRERIRAALPADPGFTPLLLHGEVTDRHVDIFDREAAFIERILGRIIADFPALRIVFEHTTTEDAVRFVEASGALLGATITPHHLVINRNAMFEGGMRPHLYCLPVAKRERHRLALRRAATSGNPKFFLGTDSAPHAVGDKEAPCGCAGIFNAPVALETYATVFEEEGALGQLEAFASENGPRFYGLPLNSGSVALTRTSWRVAESVAAAGTGIVPFQAGATLQWRFAGQVISRLASAPEG